MSTVRSLLLRSVLSVARLGHGADDKGVEGRSRRNREGEPATARALKATEIDLDRIGDWAAKKVPPESQHQARLEVTVRGANVTLFELQPPECPDHGPD